MASDPSERRDRPLETWALHDVVEPMTDHVIMTYPAGVQRLERRSRKIGCDWNGASRRRDDHSGRLKRPMGYSGTGQRRSALSSAHHARARCRRSQHRLTGDLLERTGHPDPITSRLLMSASDVPRRQRGAGCAVQAPADGPAGHAPAGCAYRRASHVPADHGRPLAEGRCAAPSNACARTAMRTSRSPRSLRMPACRASTSAAPSRKAPGSRRMPGCASTGSSRP